MEWLNLEGFENRSIWLVSISQMRPLERLYTATFSAYVTANKIACILRTLRRGEFARIVRNYEGGVSPNSKKLYKGEGESKRPNFDRTYYMDPGHTCNAQWGAGSRNCCV